MRYLWKYAERWNAVLEKKRLMNSWENVGTVVLSYIVFHSGTVPAERKRWSGADSGKRGRTGAAASQAAGADPWGAGIHQAAVPDDFNVARGVCDFAGAGMADIRSLTVENRNMSYL